MIKYRTDYSGQRQPETLLIKTTDGTSIWRIYFDIKEDENKRKTRTVTVRVPVYEETETTTIFGKTVTKRVITGYNEEEQEITTTQYSAKYIEVTAPAGETISPVEKIREEVISEIDRYDSSPDVNSFTLNGNSAWLDKNTRVGLMNSTTIQKQAGSDTITLWLGTQKFEVNCDLVLNLLGALELYALSCFNVTAEHKKNVENIDNIDDLISYDYTAGYPEKLNLEV